MKVSIANYPITDGVNTSPSNLSFEESRQSQVSQGLRWRKAKVFDRGNKQTTLTFDVFRVQATIGAAEKFVLVHPTEVPTSGVVMLTMFDGTSVYLDASSCRTISGKHTGVSTSHTYVLIGGEITTTPPRT